MSSNKTDIFKLILAAMFLCLAMILPFLTGQIPQIGNMLCPMHLPILLCGFLCGPLYGFVIGFIAPILRFLIFGMPPLFPTGISMCFELAAYGLVSGILYKYKNVYISLIGAMIIGRIVWGTVRIIIYSLGKSEFGWAVFVSSAFTTAIPGIILQILLIPVLVNIIEKLNFNKK